MHINTDPANRAAIQWWREARFGMFIHWGLYALLQRGEWVMYREQIPRAEYEHLLARFNPSRFAADDWVALARDAGARYIAVTAKHHDGFCLFDSALTDFKITNTPFRRDLIGELVDACQRHDMRIVFYYSQPDWRHVNFVNRKGAFKEWQTERPEDEPDWPRYQAYLEGQVRELCTNYGRIDGIWWDGSHRGEADWRGRQLYELIKAHHPHAVVNDRARYGDFFTPERSIPELPVGVPCECCQSIHTRSWGYKEGGPYWSGPALIESLVKTSSLGANFLLNVGPKPDGTISAPERERMRLMGEWLQTNGEAVYATEGCALDVEPELRVTRRGQTLYVCLMSWPETDWLTLPTLRTEPGRARLLGHDCGLRTAATEDGISVGPLPSLPPGHGVHVVALEFGSEPELMLRERTPAAKPVVAVNGDAPVELSVADARLSGYGVKASELRVTSQTGADGTSVPVVSNFLSENQRLVWTIRSDQPAIYRVAVDARIAEPYGGSVVAVTTAGQTVSAALPAGGEIPAFEQTLLGTVELAAGRHELVLQPGSLALGYTLGGSLRAVILERCSG